MSAEACIRFIAPFSEELLPYLEYTERVYENCTNEHLVVGTLFFVHGGWASGELAGIFGCKIGDASTWNITDFHDPDYMRAGSLYALFREDVSQEIETLRTLLKNPAAKLFFDPNN